jgi:hypothetical protein
MKRLGRAFLIGTAALVGGVGIVILSDAFEMLEWVLWPGALADRFFSPLPPGSVRKDPDPLWFFFGNILFWSLVLLAALIIAGRLARARRQRVMRVA